MQVNSIQYHLPNSSKLSSRFDSFQNYTYVYTYVYSQTWPKNTNNFMTKHFLAYREISGSSRPIRAREIQ